MTLPSGSLNQTDFMSSPVMDATPSFHSRPSASNVRNETPFSRSVLTSSSNADSGTSKLTAVALLVPANSDS